MECINGVYKWSTAFFLRDNFPGTDQIILMKLVNTETALVI